MMASKIGMLVNSGHGFNNPDSLMNSETYKKKNHAVESSLTITQDLHKN